MRRVSTRAPRRTADSPGVSKVAGMPGPLCHKIKISRELNGRTEELEATSEGSPNQFLRAYWMGRYWRFIREEQ